MKKCPEGFGQAGARMFVPSSGNRELNINHITKTVEEATPLNADTTPASVSFTPHIEVTKRKDIDGKVEYAACLHIPGDMVEFMVHNETHKMETAFDNTNQFLDRIRFFGKALDIEVEENF